MKPLLKLDSNLDQWLLRFLNEERRVFVYRLSSSSVKQDVDNDSNLLLRPSKGGSLVALWHPFVYLCRLTSGGNCRFRKLSLLSCQLLSAVGTLVTNCRHILTQCRLSLKPLGRPLY